MAENQQTKHIDHPHKLSTSLQNEVLLHRRCYWSSVPRGCQRPLYVLPNAFPPRSSVNTVSDIFQKLTANGVQGGVYQNIRPNTNNNSPVTDLASNDLRCNVGGGSGASTTTVSVAAGSTVTFTADIAVYHQGPVSFYLTKAASTAERRWLGQMLDHQ